MYNIRHLAILVTAVFLALGLGIAIGFTANSDEILIQQQKKIITRLEMDYGMLKSENKAKSEELSRIKSKQQEDEEFLEALLSEIFYGKLSDKKIAILHHNNLENLYPIKDFLETLGAQITLENKFNEDTLTKIEEKIVQALTQTNGSEPFNGTSSDIISSFSHVPVDHFIIINNQASKSVFSLVNNFLKLNKTVVLIQNSNHIPNDLLGKPRFIWLQDLNSVVTRYRLIDFLIKNSNNTSDR